ncbi:SDR family oxidoreductase [Rothia sp. AR01]|uniref:SDR family oxidoreductase n=1 Tax=Rothia santali TaxID=2949643 RepID=A0A9X2KGS2_9MICC|nr:SDR family oxidoreductase [Rothia santali]MCP3425137.1 SDR family oxidoreductase [Rothia santali]
MKIQHSTALVTGATGGLGQQFVAQILSRGAKKVYAASRREHHWNDERVVPLHLDVTDPAEVLNAVEVAQDVNLLINNAGVTGPTSLLHASETDIRDVFETNLFAPLVLTRSFAPALAQNGGGAIINLHSVLSWLAQPGVYSPSKAAFWGLTNSLRLELADQETQVLGAHLGYADTPMTERLTGVDKVNPFDVVAAVLNALEAGEEEAITDAVSVSVRSALSENTTGRLQSSR